VLLAELERAELDMPAADREALVALVQLFDRYRERVRQEFQADGPNG